MRNHNTPKVPDNVHNSFYEHLCISDYTCQSTSTMDNHSIAWLIKPLLQLILLFLLISTESFANAEPIKEYYSFSIPTLKRSYFQLDKNNNALKLNDLRLPYPGKKDEYIVKSHFTNLDTAFFVIDPWDNAPSDFLNKNYGKIIDLYILPLIIKAAQKNFQIFIFTNKCSVIKPVPYSCSIPKTFSNLSLKHQNVKIVFWQDIYDPQDFLKQIKDTGVKNIIYTGFASNMCILSRSVGMYQTSNSGFKLYFIPKASAAVETTKTWKTQDVHKITSIIISQGLGALIEYNDIFKCIN